MYTGLIDEKGEVTQLVWQLQGALILIYITLIAVGLTLGFLNGLKLSPLGESEWRLLWNFTIGSMLGFIMDRIESIKTKVGIGTSLLFCLFSGTVLVASQILGNFAANYTVTFLFAIIVGCFLLKLNKW